MPTNSSTSNDSVLHPQLPSIGTIEKCLLSAPNSYIFTAYNVTNIFILPPLCIVILMHGLQQWRQKRKTSPFDSFTYHTVVMELSGFIGCVLGCCGVFLDDIHMLFPGFLLLLLTWYGELFFHVLTCVERYLAVVHPITYLSLRSERGVRIRNATFCLSWLLSSVGMSLWMDMRVFIIVNVSIGTLSLIFISFCSLSVLCVLIRPGPGEKGGKRGRVDQSKRRAFYTIVAILGVLVLRLASSLLWAVISYSVEDGKCILMPFGLWFSLPSRLALPLLFLHKERKLMCGKKNVR